MKTKVLLMISSIILIIISAFCYFLYLNYPCPEKLAVVFKILHWIAFATGILVFIPARSTSISFKSIALSIFIAGAICFVSYVAFLKFIGIGPLIGS